MTGGQDLRRGRKLRLVRPDPRRPDRSVRLDQERRRPRHASDDEAEAVPDAVGAEDVLPLVDQDVERQPRLLDVAADLLAPVRDDGGDLQAGSLVGGEVARELTEPVAAVRSSRAAMERQQQRTAREEVDERSRPSLLVRQHESRRARQRRRAHQST
jgi:hypothetical protein